MGRRRPAAPDPGAVTQRRLADEREDRMSEQRKLSRRGFVGAAGGAAAAAGLGPWVPAAAGSDGRGGDRLLPRDRIGIQLFTVRDQVASLGFEEVSGACARSATARSSSPATTRRAAGGRTRSCGGCSAGTACAASAAM